MKHFSILAALAGLLLAGCGSSDEPAATAQPAEDAATPQAAMETPAAADTAATDEDAAPQLVEESSAQDTAATDDDKPLVLAQAEMPAASREWEFEEGRDFERLVPTQPLWGGSDKIEVVEIFWYGCNHCFDFERFINPWAANLPADVRFVRIPVTWSRAHVLHAQLYFAEQVLAENGKIADPEGFRAAVFAEYHRRGNRLLSMDAIQELFAKHGVSEADFNNAWNSFPVNQRLNKAIDLIGPERYNISGVPAVIVNGKYRAMNQQGYPKLLELMDELIERERVNRAN